MRFAWEIKQFGYAAPEKRRFTHPMQLVTLSYNIIWWIPVILPFTGVISYEAGFIAFLAVTMIRLIVNMIRNNLMKTETALDFPLRS